MQGQTQAADLFGASPVRGETQTAFARRVGLSQQRVSQLVRDGLPTLPNGRIDPEPAAAWVAQRLDVERRARGKSNARAGRPVGGDDDAGGDQVAPSLVEARRRHELLKAERTALRLKTEARDLMPRIDAARAAFEFTRAIRDSWTGWASRMAPRLAAETGAEVGATFSALDRAVREHLVELAEMPVPEGFTDA